MSPGLWQIILVGVIFAVLFMGPKRLPNVGKSLGEAIRGFKKGLAGEEEIDVTDSSKAQSARAEQLHESDSSSSKAGAHVASKKTTTTEHS